MKRTILLCVLSATLAAVSAWAAENPKGDPAKGRMLYMTNGCSYCHGTAGQGGGGRTGGLRLAQMGIAYPAFMDQLRHPRNEMPPYVEAALPEKDAADIYAFVAAMPPPPDLKSIPILNN